MFCQQALQLIGILLRAVIAAVIAAITIGNANVGKFAQHRQINPSALLVAGNRHSSEGGAVISLATADNLVARFLPDFDLILARQLESSLNRFGAAAGEVHGAAVEVVAGKFQHLAREIFGGFSDELGGMNKLQIGGLRRHGFADLFYPVSNEIHGGAASEIEIFLACRVPEPDAFAANGGGELFSKVAGEESGHGKNP